MHGQLYSRLIKWFKTIFPLLAFWGSTNQLLSQVELIAPTDQGTLRNSNMSSVFYEFQGNVYFNALDPTGYALYRTDGTSDGTICLTHDINPQSFTSCGDWLYVFGTKVQYANSVYAPVAGYAIWRMKADGTGYRKLVDLDLPFLTNAHLFYFSSSGNKIYYSWLGGFSWIDNDTGIVTDNNPGLSVTGGKLGGYDLVRIEMAGNGFYFMVDYTTKENFFFTDLLNHTTVPLAGIQTPESKFPINNIKVFNNKCYFLHVADSSQLWESDGTKDGTRKIWQNISNIPNDGGRPFFSAFIESQGKLVFDVPESEGDSAWHAVYTFDGQQVKLLQKHPDGWQNLTFINSPDALFVFVLAKNDTRVWKLDQSGYQQVGTLKCRATWGTNGCWQDGQIFFPASDSLLVLDDQTLECIYSTRIHGTLYPTAQGVFFNMLNGSVGDPYVLHTSPPSCTLLKKMVWNYQNATIDNLFPLGDRLFFIENSDSTGKELWTTTGNPESTHLVKEINTAGYNISMRGTNPNSFAAFRNQLAFTATGFSADYMDKQAFTGLWMTDGSEKGTVKIEDLKIDDDSPDNTKVVFQDKIWFIAQNKTYGDKWRIWVSNGQPDGARIFDTDFQGRHFDRPYGLTVSGDLLYFFAHNDQNVIKLWVTDGSETGTRCIDDLLGDADYSYSLYFTPQRRAAGGRLFFTRDKLTESSGGLYIKSREVWVTDATKSGTQCLADNSDDISKDLTIRFLGSHKGNLIFTYTTPQDGFELWYSEGERSTTRRLTGYQDPGPNPDKSFSGTTSLGDQFFFTAFTEQNGFELWASDGTPEGTGIFMELAHGKLSTRPHDLTLIGDKMAFFCDGESVSQPLWVTDGTPEGTEPLSWNDTPISNIHNVRFWNHALYFVASDPEAGEGLYRYELPGTLGTKHTVTHDMMNDIRVYPNPTHDLIHLDLTNECRFPMNFSLVNSSGCLVKQLVIKTKQSDISIKDFPSGIYFLRCGDWKQSVVKE